MIARSKLHNNDHMPERYQLNPWTDFQNYTRIVTTAAYQAQIHGRCILYLDHTITITLPINGTVSVVLETAD